MRIIFLLLAIASLSASAYADCPPCFFNQQPLEPRHGYRDGRRRVLVGIEVGPNGRSWADPPGGSAPDQRLAVATGKAMGEWNRATDEEGKKISYYFDSVGEGSPSTAADILIVKRPRVNDAGGLNPRGGDGDEGQSAVQDVHPGRHAG